MRNAIVVALMLAFAVEGRADSIVRLSSGGETKTVFDNGVGDLSPADGVVVLSGSVGNFVFNMTMAFSKPFLGSPTEGTMQLKQVSLSGGAGSLTIEFTDTDFLAAAPSLAFDADIFGVTTGTVSYDLKVDPSNTAFGGNVISSLGSFGPGVFGGATGTLLNGLSAFSMTMVIQVDHAGWGITAFDANATDPPVVAAPEPSLLGLLGCALGAIVLRRRRRA